MCQLSSHSDQGFSFYSANIPTRIPTQTHHDTVIAISAPPYYVVGAVNYLLRLLLDLTTIIKSTTNYDKINIVLQYNIKAYGGEHVLEKQSGFCWKKFTYTHSYRASSRARIFQKFGRILFFFLQIPNISNGTMFGDLD